MQKIFDFVTYGYTIKHIGGFFSYMTCDIM